MGGSFFGIVGDCLHRKKQSTDIDHETSITQCQFVFLDLDIIPNAGGR